MRQIVPIFRFYFKTKHIILTNYDQIGVGGRGGIEGFYQKWPTLLVLMATSFSLQISEITEKSNIWKKKSILTETRGGVLLLAVPMII